jgi:hypothetical protein
VFERIFSAANHDSDREYTIIDVNSTAMKVLQHWQGSKKGLKQAIGKSKGGSFG